MRRKENPIKIPAEKVQFSRENKHERAIERERENLLSNGSNKLRDVSILRRINAREQRRRSFKYFPVFYIYKKYKVI